MTCFRLGSAFGALVLFFAHVQHVSAAQHSLQLPIPGEDAVIDIPMGVQEAAAPVSFEEYKKQHEVEIKRAEAKQKQQKHAAVQVKQDRDEINSCCESCAENCCTCISKKRSDCLTDWTLQGLKGCCYGSTVGSMCLICWTSIDSHVRYDTCVLPTAHDSLPVWIACLPVAAWCSYFVTRAVSQRKKDQ